MGSGKQTYMMTLRGVTDNSGTTGQCALSGTLLHTALTSFRIPRGQKVKIWSIGGVAEGQATKFFLEYSVDGSTYKELDRLFIVATTMDVQARERRKPDIRSNYNGTATLRISWSQGTAALAYITVVIEICDSDDDE